MGVECNSELRSCVSLGVWRRRPLRQPGLPGREAHLLLQRGPPLLLLHQEDGRQWVLWALPSPAGDRAPGDVAIVQQTQPSTWNTHTHTHTDTHTLMQLSRCSACSFEFIYIFFSYEFCANAGSTLLKESLKYTVNSWPSLCACWKSPQIMSFFMCFLFSSSQRICSVPSGRPQCCLSWSASCTCCRVCCCLSVSLRLPLRVTVWWGWPWSPCSPGPSSATLASTGVSAAPLTKQQVLSWSR